MFPDKGTFKVLSTELEANTNKNYNAGNYVEIDGQPFAVLSNGFGNSKPQKINLKTLEVTDVKWGSENPGSVKDFVWVSEGIKVGTKNY